MKISTKGRYALRVMVDIAERRSDEYIKLADIAERQDISEKYLEGILSSMTKAGLLHGLRGKGGGYRLALAPDRITAGRVIREAEGSLAPVTCLASSPNQCPRAADCKTLPLWQGLEKAVNAYLDSITIADLADGGADNYCI